MISNREEFKDYCLRALSAPIYKIDITPEQIDDRITEAFSFAYDFYYDSTEDVLYKHEVTQIDKDNRYITLPDEILSVKEILPINALSYGSYLFDIRYQVALNDLHNLTSRTMTPFFVSMMHINLIDDIVNSKPRLRYNRLGKKLSLDYDWDKINTGEFIIVDAVARLDESMLYNERPIQRLAIALLKLQWAMNMSKYKDLPIVGGMVLNADDMYSKAMNEKMEAESEIQNNYSQFQQMFIG